MIYSYSYTIPSFLCDSHDTLALWGVARLFQEVAGQHVAAAGLGFSQLIEQGMAWVLCRACYEVRRLPREGEEVCVATWSRGDDGLFAFREYELRDAHGQLCVASSAYWAVMDFGQRRVVRLRQLMSSFEHHPASATGLVRIDRLRLPKEAQAAEEVARFAVRPSMLDHTHHVNNAEYVKWIFDHLPDQRMGAAPLTFKIEYLHETPPDDTVILRRHSGAGELFFQIDNSGGTAVAASITAFLVNCEL